MKKKVSHPIKFLPCFSPLFNFKNNTSCPVYSSSINTSISTYLWPKQALEQFYFIFLSPETATSTLLKHRIKNYHKREKSTMQFICISHPHDNVPPLSNRLPGKKKGGQEVRSEERMELSGTEESRKLPRPRQHKWDTVEPQEGEKERLEVRSWCFCTSNSCQDWYFALPVSGCNPRTPESRLGFEQGTGLC